MTDFNVFALNWLRPGPGEKNTRYDNVSSIETTTTDSTVEDGDEEGKESSEDEVESEPEEEFGNNSRESGFVKFGDGESPYRRRSTRLSVSMS